MANLIINLSTISKTKEGNVYKDVSFPVTRTFTANVNAVAVKQSIANLFNWRRGQRILDPLFGNILYEYVYQPINDVTIKNLKSAVIQMLRYEPRITILSLDITANEDDHLLHVELRYLIPKLNVIEAFSTSIQIISQ